MHNQYRASDDIVLAATPKPVGNSRVSLPPIGILVLVVSVTATEPLLLAVRLCGATVEDDIACTANDVPLLVPVSSGIPYIFHTVKVLNILQIKISNIFYLQLSPHEMVVSPHENASRLPNEYESNTLELYRGNFEVSKKEH